MAKAATTKSLTPRKKKSVRAARRISGMAAMPMSDWNKAKFYVHYEVETKDWVSAVKGYAKKYLSKLDYAAIDKLPEWKVGGGSHWALTAYLLEHNPALVPDSYKKGIEKLFANLIAEGKTIISVKKEESKKEVYVPNIQERLQEATEDKLEELEQWIDDFLRDPKANPLKDKQPLAYFKSKEMNLGHARFIQKWYEGAMSELEELVTLPIANKQDDMQQQLAEGYNHFTKLQQKELHDFYKRLFQALDILRAEKKQVRPVRKVKQKSAVELVKRLKFKVSDSVYGIASVPPAELIGATVAVVFNTKNRKLGVYYAENGQVFQVRGTTLLFFDENKSVQKTIRKPEEILPQWKKVTRHKVPVQFDYLKTTDIKMNGRFNEDTVILKVFQ
jgi:hypothetical protein|tara:strand:+ start:2534 stop:3700 length:1167 start_codon:yes stop_codon:yes gene_type:complete